MQEKKKIGIDLTQGSVAKVLLRFMLPFLLASVLQTLYSTVDMIVVGQYVGSIGTVAVSMGSKIANLFTMFSMAFSTAGQIYVGQQIGAGSRDDVNKTIGTLTTMLLAISVTAAVLVGVGNHFLLVIMNTPEEAMTEAYSYLLIICFGFPFIYGYNAACAVLRGMGDSKSPLLFVAISSITNLVLDIILVVAFGMASAGAAIATVISQLAACVFAVIYLYKRRDIVGFDFKLTTFKINKEHASVLLKIGIPLSARQMLIGVTQLFVTSFANDFGLYAAAAYGVSERLYNLVNTVDSAFNQASAGMIAQNIGARKHDRVRQIVRTQLLMAGSIAVICGIVLNLFPTQFFALFNNEAEVLVYAPAMCIVLGISLILAVVSGTFQGVVNGAGRGGLALVGGILDSVVFRFGFCYLFAYMLDLGVVGFSMGTNFARVAPATVGLVYYLSGKWKTDSLVKEKDTAGK